MHGGVRSIGIPIFRQGNSRHCWKWQCHAAHRVTELHVAFYT